MEDFVVWLSSYCLGDSKIDRQHQELVKMLNFLHYKICSGCPNKIIDEILIKLINYAENHFRDEEELMKIINYPDLPRHQKEHERLVIEVFEFKRRYEQKQVSKYDLLDFLRNWLISRFGY